MIPESHILPMLIDRVEKAVKLPCATFPFYIDSEFTCRVTSSAFRPELTMQLSWKEDIVDIFDVPVSRGIRDYGIQYGELVLKIASHVDCIKESAVSLERAGFRLNRIDFNLVGDTKNAFQIDLIDGRLLQLCTLAFPSHPWRTYAVVRDEDSVLYTWDYVHVYAFEVLHHMCVYDLGDGENTLGKLIHSTSTLDNMRNVVEAFPMTLRDVLIKE